MEDHYYMFLNAKDEWKETGRWSLSVACGPGPDRDGLAEATLGGKWYCASDLATIRDAGFDVVPDDAPHGLLMLGEAPSQEPQSWHVHAALWDTVRSLFHGPYLNHGYPGYTGGQE